MLEKTKWQSGTQSDRNKRAADRFRYFYPPENYRTIDEHQSLIEFLDLVRDSGIDACFIRFPTAPEFEAAMHNPKFPRYLEARKYVRSLVEQRGLRYFDAPDLELGLKRRHFRDGDHLLKPVIEQLTRPLVESCFPDLSEKS